MKVLVIGSGGREHALVWKLRQSPRVREILCAPGNGGIAESAECVPVKADDVEGLRNLARERGVDLTLVGPELPLTLGIVDAFEADGLRIFGPTGDGARLEGSKAFAKELLVAEGVPTARAKEFTDAAEAREWIREVGAPIVVKADGLAAGKGVSVCATVDEAVDAADRMLRDGEFGAAGKRIVVEEFLDGEEASIIAVTDGETILTLDSSQDHKRIFDGDRGPNTGGMGAYSPAPVIRPQMARQIVEEILEPTLRGLRRRGLRYRGVLYAGLMIDDSGPKVLEFNVRFGDPECQALLVRLRTDLVDIVEASLDGRLSELNLEWDPRPAVCVVLAAEGYPGSVRKGDRIEGLDGLGNWKNGVVFHAGTARQDDGIVTAGGRVLGVTGLGRDIREAIDETYRAVERIHWTGMQFRRDIGARAVGRA